MKTEQEILEKIAEIDNVQSVRRETIERLVHNGWFGSAIITLENYEHQEIEKSILLWVLEAKEEA